MEAVAVLATLTGVASSAQFVHGQRKSLVCFLADGAEGHGTGYKVLHNLRNGLNLVNADRVALEAEEVTQEYRVFLLIGQLGKLLEFLVAAQTGGQLQTGDGFRIPGVLLSALAVRELADVRQQVFLFVGVAEAVIMEE